VARKERKMAASTFYLEHYLDSLEDLPVDLKNNFSRMHDLDKRYQYLVPSIQLRYLNFDFGSWFGH
jgi:hypothetical protein